MIALKSLLAVLALATLAVSPDELADVRNREYALAAAIRSQDQSLLQSLLAEDFHVSWTFGSAVRNVRIELSRPEWMDGLRRLRSESYVTHIESVRPAGEQTEGGPNSSAYVTLMELWTINSFGGGQIQKRIRALDLWIKQQHGWRVMSRLCQSDVR